MSGFFNSLSASLLNFLQKGTGAVLQTVAKKLEQDVTPLDFMNVFERADILSGTCALDVSAAFDKANPNDHRVYYQSYAGVTFQFFEMYQRSSYAEDCKGLDGPAPRDVEPRTRCRADAGRIKRTWASLAERDGKCCVGGRRRNPWCESSVPCAHGARGGAGPRDPGTVVWPRRC